MSYRHRVTLFRYTTRNFSAELDEIVGPEWHRLWEEAELEPEQLPKIVWRSLCLAFGDWCATTIIYPKRPEFSSRKIVAFYARSNDAGQSGRPSNRVPSRTIG